ncbi:MAG: DUF1127 domain-containing protein [Pseudomonadota bacterium]
MKAMTRSSFATRTRNLPAGNLLAKIVTAWQVARERRNLSQLDARTLKDIGMTEEQASYEAGRAFWDLPVNR